MSLKTIFKRIAVEFNPILNVPDR